jgi:hypothetical protein
VCTPRIIPLEHTSVAYVKDMLLQHLSQLEQSCLSSPDSTMNLQHGVLHVLYGAHATVICSILAQCTCQYALLNHTTAAAVKYVQKQCNVHVNTVFSASGTVSRHSHKKDSFFIYSGPTSTAIYLFLFTCNIFMRWTRVATCKRFFMQHVGGNYAWHMRLIDQQP